MPDDIAQLKAHFNPIRHDTLGPQVMGLFADAVMGGALIIQLIHWTSWSRCDKAFVRAIVALSAILTAATTMLIFAHAWSDLIRGWGKYVGLVSVRFSSWYRILNGLTTATTQLFFVNRAAKLSVSPLATWVACTLLVVGGCAAAIAAFVSVRHDARGDEFGSMHGSPARYTWLGSTVLIDALLSGIIIWNLVRTKTGWAYAVGGFRRVIRICLEAQVSSVIFAVVFLITFRCRGGTRFPLFFDLSIGKIYVLAMTTLLNAKISLKREQEVGQNESFLATRSGKYKNATVMVSTEIYSESHQLQRLPPAGVPRRPSGLEGHEEDEIESEVNINLSDNHGSSSDLSTALAVKPSVGAMGDNKRKEPREPPEWKCSI
ncbi:hypothetical protein DB88DRAFT_513546 [Papiliotrema laurentii]|uniref:Uncharacterized protein n=1 Tax=Papiliotrema laurentii TaxID=5418 RepID=A0AAD9FMF4_PAPLA|nr:hypothetical protein DB88DRAFT_513546 [Papiliotrema laurentii]